MKRNYWWIAGALFAFWFSICCSPAHARDHLRLGFDYPYEVYVDKGGTLAINEVAALPPSSFVPLQKGLSLGYTDAVAWLRLEMPAAGWPGSEWRLEVQPPLLDSIILYEATPFGWYVRQAGSRYPFVLREADYRYIVFRMTSSHPPLPPKVIYIRVQSGNALYLLAELKSPAEFARQSELHTALWGGYFGSVALMLGFVFIMAIINRTRRYLALSMVLLANSVQIFNAQGFLTGLFWFGRERWGDISGYVTAPLAIASIIWATRAIVTSRNPPRWLGNLYLMGAWFCTLVPLSALYGYYHEAYITALVLNLLGVIGAITILASHRKDLVFSDKVMLLSLASYIIIYIHTTRWLLGFTPVEPSQIILRAGLIEIFCMMISAALLLEIRQAQHALLQQKTDDLEICTISGKTLKLKVEEQTEVIQKSSMLYQSILELSPDDVTITDLTGSITMVSAASMGMFGYQRVEEQIGRNVIEFVAPEDRERAMGNFKRVLTEGHSGLEVYKAVRADGSTFTINVNGKILPNGTGEPTSIIFVVRDITEEVRLKQDLLTLLESKRRLLLEQRNFLSMVSHEFRTPLAVIDSAAINLMAVPVAGQGDLDRRAHQIQRATRSLSQLIDNCLTSERIDDGGFQLMRQQIPVIELVTETAQIVTFSQRHVLQLECDNAPAIWALDPTLIKIALSNLIDNAIKYSEQGTVTVSACLCDGGRLCIGVTDEGFGIGEHEAKSLFEKFVRGDAAQRGKSIRGSGLGLFITRRIAQAHGGDLVLKSREPGATRFELWLPGEDTA